MTIAIAGHLIFAGLARSPISRAALVRLTGELAGEAIAKVTRFTLVVARELKERLADPAGTAQASAALQR